LSLFAACVVYAAAPCFEAGDFAQHRQVLLHKISDGVIVLDAELAPSDFFISPGWNASLLN
jgi:hypothetical protein